MDMDALYSVLGHKGKKETAHKSVCKKPSHLLSYMYRTGKQA